LPGGKTQDEKKAPPQQCYVFEKSESWSARHFFQHFQTDFAGGDFAQCSDTGLVFALDFGRVALGQHAGAVSGSQYQLETVRDLGETVFNSNACHGDVLQCN